MDVSRGDPEDWNTFKYHFLVMDDAAYRIETDIEKAQALANFADKSFAQGLSNTFDSFRSNGESILSLPEAA